MATEREDANTGSEEDAYELYMGRWSRLVGAEFLDWLGLPTGLRWLDIGCGTGAFSQTILERCAPREIVGVDPSADYIAHAAASAPSSAISYRTGDAQALAFDDASFDAVVSALVINFVPDKPRAAGEMARVAKPGGTVALYVWDLDGGLNTMRHFWRAAAEVDPGAAAENASRGASVTHPDALAALFDGAGLKRVETHPISITTRFRDLDDYWLPVERNAQAVGRYCRSLTDAERGAIRERLMNILPTGPDGAIAFENRAWAVRGKV